MKIFGRVIFGKKEVVIEEIPKTEREIEKEQNDLKVVEIQNTFRVDERLAEGIMKGAKIVHRELEYDVSRKQKAFKEKLFAELNEVIDNNFKDQHVELMEENVKLKREIELLKRQNDTYHKEVFSLKHELALHNIAETV